MTTHEGDDPMAPGNLEVLIALSKIEGQLTTFVGMVSRHDNDLRSLDNRVTTLEATRKAATPWHTTLGTIAPWIALLLIVAERLYAK